MLISIDKLTWKGKILMVSHSQIENYRELMTQPLSGMIPLPLQLTIQYKVVSPEIIQTQAILSVLNRSTGIKGMFQHTGEKKADFFRMFIILPFLNLTLNGCHLCFYFENKYVIFKYLLSKIKDSHYKQIKQLVQKANQVLNSRLLSARLQKR